MNKNQEIASLRAVSDTANHCSSIPAASQPRPAAAVSQARLWKAPLLCKPVLCACAAVLFVLALAPAKARAQTDEIQVYDASIARRGIFNVTVHNNFTPIGRTTPAYPGAIIPNHSWNGGIEWAYGLKTWWEQGMYLPIYTGYSDGHGGTIDGLKIRELFVRPHADQHTLFYGVNFEFSFNYGYWESRTESGEIRPIIGVNLHKWELVYNPIVDTDYTGGLGGLEFNPGGMIKYNFNDTWSVATEEFDGFGSFNDFAPLHDQFHEVWAMLDHNSPLVDVEAGIGVGLTAGSDRLTLKLMLSRDLNKTPIRF